MFDSLERVDTAADTANAQTNEASNEGKRGFSSGLDILATVRTLEVHWIDQKLDLWFALYHWNTWKCHYMFSVQYLHFSMIKSVYLVPVGQRIASDLAYPS